MQFFRTTIFRLGLSLVLALSAVSGTAAATDGAPPTPPTATSVALNTYGSLPIVVLNLTQSPINMTISTNSGSYGAALPIAAGLPGVYYPSNGTTPVFTNIVSSTAAGPGAASLMPAVTMTTANNITFSNNFDWMSLFTVFPSWTQSNSYYYVQYVSLSNLNNVSAAAGSANVVAGFPSTDAKSITKMNPKSPTGTYYTNALGLNAGNPCVTSLNLNLLENGQTAATYKININSLGGGTSGSVPIASNGFSILKAMHTALNVVSDIAVIASGDPLGIVDFIAGIPATIDGIVTDITNNSNNVNSNVTTDKAYPATSRGINVTAAATTSGGTLTAYSGDSQSLVYEVQPAANQTLPLVQQNAVFVTTWRQTPGGNYGVALPNSADALFVTVINQGVYASNQVQQYINNNSPSQMTGGAKYKPTKAQAQDSTKILGILTALSKENPQDTKYLIEMFGVHGKFDTIKNDPSAKKVLNDKLKEAFEKHKNGVPEVEQYLMKLAQKH